MSIQIENKLLRYVHLLSLFDEEIMQLKLQSISAYIVVKSI